MNVQPRQLKAHADESARSAAQPKPCSHANAAVANAAVANGPSSLGEEPSPCSAEAVPAPADDDSDQSFADDACRQGQGDIADRQANPFQEAEGCGTLQAASSQPKGPGGQAIQHSKARQGAMQPSQEGSWVQSA